MTVKKIEGWKPPERKRPVQSYRLEEIEDLYAMLREDPAWLDGSVTIKMGVIEVERLLVTAIRRRVEP